MISVLFLCFFVDGVFGVDADEVKSVSGMEGQNVTLYTDATDIQIADRIVWVFGTERTRIAQHNIAAHKISLYEDVLDGKFRLRLMLDRHTGSLTITNITTTDSGLYGLQILRGTDVISRSFSIIVSAHLPIPQITSDCPQNTSSVSKCVLLCSVMNVSHVTLSWYKGKSFFSRIIVSDLKIRVSLPLEVEYHDTNTYRCVINNPITNHTQHLNITQLCHKCSVKWSGASEKQEQTSHLTVVICVAVSVLGVVSAVVAFCIYWKLRKTNESGQASEELVELNAKESCVGADETKTTTDGVKYITVKAGASFELHTGVKDIQKCDLIQWKFGEAAESTNPFILISRRDKNREELLQNDISEKLRDGLKLDKKTGSITVENSRTTDTGFYKLEIDSSTEQVLKCFFVTVSETTS